MEISQGGVLAGLAVLSVIGLILILVISVLNVAMGLQTLAVFVAVWSFFFGLIYAGMFAYNSAMGGGATGNETKAPSSAPSDALTPLSDDFLKALDEQLKAQEPAGVQSPFRGDD